MFQTAAASRKGFQDKGNHAGPNEKNFARCAPGRYLLSFSSVTLLLKWEAGCYRVDIGGRAAVMNQTPSRGDYLCRLLLHRLYFTLKKKAPAMSVTVSPCDSPVEWSLAARTLKDKPLKSLQCEGTTRVLR